MSSYLSVVPCLKRLSLIDGVALGIVFITLIISFSALLFRWRNFSITTRWILLFIVVSSCFDVVGAILSCLEKNNLQIVNGYSFFEFFLFYAIWAEGRLLQVKKLLPALLVFVAFLAVRFLEIQEKDYSYTAYANYIYQLFFVYIFTNKLADTMLSGNKSFPGNPVLFFYLALILFLSADIIAGMFDRIYYHFTPAFFRARDIIYHSFMIVIYLAYLYFALCAITRKTF